MPSDPMAETSVDKTASLSGSEVDATPAPGEMHGRYVVLEELGRGGMGKVVRAYDPKLRREVALKLLRSEADPVARARIAREAQAMAQLSHPNVVAIYDVEVEADPPFIAMEVVEGSTLRDWVREHSPSWRELIEVYGAAGEGLAAAHAAGMVHRDFKPANVLRADDGRIRVMDFGIARSQDATISSDSLRIDPAPSRHGEDPPEESSQSRSSSLPALTQAGVIVGTPAYMAPEQERGRPADARTDQYAFCVALWEALAGQRPFQGDTAELAAAKAELRVTSSHDRQVPSHLRPVLLRGLQPDPHKRYPNMQALLGALRRDPARRRRGLALAAGTLVLGAAGFGANWLEQQRTQAECSGQGAAILDAWDDEVRGEVAEAFEETRITYAGEQFDRIRPSLDAFSRAWRRQRTEACLLADRGERSIDLQRHSDACFAESKAALHAQVEVLLQPDAEVVRYAIDGVSDLPDPVRCNDDAALAQRIELPADPQTREQIEQIQAGLERVTARRRVGQNTRALELSATLAEQAELIGWQPLVAETLQVLAETAGSATEVDRAIEAAERAFFSANEIGHDRVAQGSARYLSQLLASNKTRTDKALLWNDLALSLHARLGAEDDLMLADTLGARAMILEVAGRYDEAMEATQRALALREQYLPDDHPIVLHSLSSVGRSHYAKGEYGKALEIHHLALERMESALGSTHPDLADTYNHVGITYEVTGKYDLALEHLQKALTIAEASMGEQHPGLGNIHNNLGNVYQDLGQPERSREALLQALRLYERSDGPRSLSVARAHNNLANASATQGDFDEALSYQRKALGILEEVLGPGHAFCGMVRDNMGFVLYQLERRDEALDQYERGLQIREEAVGLEHPDVALSLLHLATLHRDEGRHDQAIALYERALAIRAKQDTGPEILADLQRGLALSLWESGRDRPRALEVAAEAKEGYAAAGETYADSREFLETWLRERS